MSKFDIADLFCPKLRDYILDLREKVNQSSNVKLVTSNPDYVIANFGRIAIDDFADQGEFTTYSPISVKFLDELYEYFVGKMNFENLIGFASVKSSFRPDRRLQIPHEGSLMKAIYAHIVTRDWILNPNGLKYIAIGGEVKKSDREALKTVATHSITTVTDLPQAAVDAVFEINNDEGLCAFCNSFLTPTT